MTAWPEFHNGVATGLKLSKHILSINPHHLRTWIFYQKPDYQRPDVPKFEHAGFLFGFFLFLEKN